MMRRTFSIASLMIFMFILIFISLNYMQTIFFGIDSQYISDNKTYHNSSTKINHIKTDTNKATEWTEDYNNPILVFPDPKIVHQTPCRPNHNRCYFLQFNSNMKFQFNDFTSRDENSYQELYQQLFESYLSSLMKQSKVVNNSIVATNRNIDLITIVKVNQFHHSEFYTLNSSHSRDSESSIDEEGYYHIKIFENKKYDGLELQLEVISETGMRYAFVTLFQILLSPYPIAVPLEIIDWPSYSWRGILIDVARHFIPINLLQRLILALEASKFNYLHLHLTDSQSFPLLLDDVDIDVKYAEYSTDGDNYSRHFRRTIDSNGSLKEDYRLNLSQLAYKGAFSLAKIYSKDDMKRLVSYASDHGIEIIPEIDMPAHSLSWSKAFNTVVVHCDGSVSKLSPTPENVYPLNPINPLTMEIIKQVLTQISEIFPSPYLHIGGDEVKLPCLADDKNIFNWASTHNETMLELFKDFERNVFSIVKSLNKIPVVWQGIQDADAMPSERRLEARKNHYNPFNKSVIQPWKCWSGLAVTAAITASKSYHPVVNSACWYLDYDTLWLNYLMSDVSSEARTALAHEQSHHQIVSSFQFQNDSNDDRSIKNLTSLFWGGEGAMWSEHVDATNFECRIWPRAAAIGAKLWGWNPYQYSNHRNDSADILSIETSKLLLKRYTHFRYVLENLGLKPARLEFHYPKQSQYFRSLYATPMIPYYPNSETDAFQKIDKIQYGLNMKTKSTDFIISSQCGGLSQSIQRPSHSTRISFAQINIADGATNYRLQYLQKWLIEKASQGFVGIGFCELNGWQKLSDDINIIKNHQLITQYAMDAGFPYAYILSNSQSYPIGFMSILPFQILGQYGPPNLYRGLLHVYIPSIQVHVMIVHLHPHSSIQRISEVQFIYNQIISPLLLKQSKLLLMGDFNTLSPFNHNDLMAYNFIQFCQRQGHSLYERFKLKFLIQDNQSINYDPMTILLRGDMMDSCYYLCQEEIDSTLVVPTYVSYLNISQNVNECFHRYCKATEPTLFQPEWPFRDQSHPFLRLDYILISRALQDQIVSSSSNVSYQDVVRSRQCLNDISWLQSCDTNLSRAHYGEVELISFCCLYPRLFTVIENTTITSRLSDHYPVIISWRENIQLYGRRRV